MVDSKPLAAFLTALSSAEGQLGRLEGRLAGASFQRAWQERMALREAASYAWNRGEVVPLDELVLHDNLMDLQAPTLALAEAHAMLRQRRKAIRAEAGRLLTWEGLNEVLGPGVGARNRLGGAFGDLEGQPKRRRRAASTPPALPFLAALDLPHGLDDEHPEALFALWIERLNLLLAEWPPVLVAALLLDLWLRLDPLPRQAYCGPLLVEAVVRREQRTRHALLHLETGRRMAEREGDRWFAADDDLRRITVCLATIACGAAAGAEEVYQMTIAQGLLNRRITGRRANSRLPALAELLLATPIVTAPLAAERLMVSQQAVRTMIGQLGGAVHEVTGQSRFRAWRI